jgi:hypothetical protein
MGDTEQEVSGGKRPEDAREPRVFSQGLVLSSQDEPGSANIGQSARPSKSWASDVEAAHAE